MSKARDTAIKTLNDVLIFLQEIEEDTEDIEDRVCDLPDQFVGWTHPDYQLGSLEDFKEKRN